MSRADETGCFSCTWEIENFDIFLRAGELKSFENGELISAAWKTETTEGSAVWWCLHVDHLLSDVRFRLVCLNKDWHPDIWESSFISSCGEILHNKFTKFTFFKSVEIFIPKADLSGKQKFSNVSQNTLTLDCKMWRNSMKNGEFRIHSVVKNVDFCCCIKDPLFFSTNTKSYSGNEIIENDNMRINMTFYNWRETDQYIICAVALPIIDGCFSFVKCEFVSDGLEHKKAPTGTSVEYNNLRTEYRNVLGVFKKRGVIPNSSCDLNLQLNSIVAYHNDYQYQVTHPTPLQLVKARNLPEAVYGPLCENLLHLYRESILSDVTINTKGKSFLAHRSILAARSPVFRGMFKENEGQSGVVDIDDVESKTMDRLLVFLYGGFLEDLQLEEASALYLAADKYDVLHLKQKCADILKAGLAADSACDALEYADRHSNDQLIKCVVDFIYDHQEVVSSTKWEKLVDSKPRLTSKIAKELFLKRGKK